MRDLVVRAFVTLDGVMQAPGGPEEDPTGGFEHGGWSVHLLGRRRCGGAWASTMGRRRSTSCSAARRTRSSPRTGRTRRTRRPTQLNAATKHVASTTLDRVDVAELAPDRGRRRRGGGGGSRTTDGPELQVHGSARPDPDAARSADLVDEFTASWIFPRRRRHRGSGCSATARVPAGLGARRTRRSRPPASCIATYRAGGELEVGSFALEEPTEGEVARRGALED